jgi:hypothetical protein
MSTSFREWLQLSEEYVAGVVPRQNKNAYYEIFKNPTSSEMRELKSQGAFARFIAFGRDIYVFPAELLHADAIAKLELNFGNEPPLKTAFLGVAKIQGSKLSMHETNQKMTQDDASNVESWHPVIKNYFV